MALATEVFFHSQRFIEALRLENYADVAAHLGGLALDVMAGEARGAFSAHHHGGKNPKERRLAAAIGTQEPEDLTRADGEIDVGQSDPAAVAVGQVLYFNHSPGLSTSIRP